MNTNPTQSHSGFRREARWRRLALLLIILAAFALRLHALTGPSLWSAEGLALYRAGQPLADLLLGRLVIGDVIVADGAGPLFPVLLSAWRLPMGDPAELSRMAPVWLGLLAVPLIYCFGRKILNARVALGAALLLAISPYHVWLSREIGPQTTLLLCTLTAALAGWHLLDSRRTGRRISWPALVLAGAALLLVVLASPGVRADSALTSTVASTGSLPAQAATLLGAGVTQTLVHQWWRYAPALILALAGVVAHWRRDPLAIITLLLYLTLPLALLWFLPSTGRAGRAYQFMVIALPPFLLLAASGWLHPWRRWRGRALGLGWLMIALQITWLPAQYMAPELRRHDIRSLAQQVALLANQEDLILIEDPAIAVTFAHYFQGDTPRLLLPGRAEQFEDEIQSELKSVVEMGGRVWFLRTSQEAAGAGEEAFASGGENWPQLATLPVAGMWLPLEMALYAPVPAVSDLPPHVPALDLDWGGELTLAGFTVPEEGKSGGLWQPDFYWRKQAGAAGQYTLFLRLVDGSGRTWSVQDWPLWAEHPPGVWSDEALLRYQPLWRLPAGLPPGEYQTWLQVVRTADGRPLPVNGAGELLLTSRLALSPADAPDGLAYLPDYTPATTRFGPELTLLGHQLPLEESYRPGHPVPLTLVWQVNDPVPADYRLRLQLLDSEAGIVQEYVGPIVHADYPPSQWSPKTLLASQTDLPIPGSAAAGRYQVMAALLPPDSDQPVNAGGIFESDNVKLADIMVEPWPMESRFPPIQTALRADFGQPAEISLAGYALTPAQTKPGELIALTLYWRAIEQIEESYAVFVHVTNAQGEVVAQDDGIPVHGFRPTTSWRSGEAIVDEHLIQLPAELATGEYSIWIGVYDPTSFERLSVMAAGVVQSDDRLHLVELTVAPELEVHPFAKGAQEK